MFPVLESIDSPAAMRLLAPADLHELARELREFLLQSVAQTGGHLSSNLGTVELTIALHYVFDTPDDRIVWDVGHQTYAHKILTGRREAMSRLRQFGGPSGFPRRVESPVQHGSSRRQGAHVQSTARARTGQALGGAPEGHAAARNAVRGVRIQLHWSDRRARPGHADADARQSARIAGSAVPARDYKKRLRLSTGRKRPDPLPR